ncbi:24870_t:CDS:2 [Cetraspora pellucida]|uniref:24870_t:CDS:1 n=1 Tax=Cetraspora pellucida TaxID=1433469 RepID=A0A9N8ZR11_9GLOM|nr:24870_t:CDS:2 [Cetraspora pellucida]
MSVSHRNVTLDNYGHLNDILALDPITEFETDSDYRENVPNMKMIPTWLHGEQQPIMREASVRGKWLQGEMIGTGCGVYDDKTKDFQYLIE